MDRYALTFTVKPGSEQEAARILSAYARPTPGGSWRSTVLMSGNRVVRVMEFAGDLMKVLAHLSEVPQTRAVEDGLAPYLERSRDLSHPEGVREFLEHAQLKPVQDRLTRSDLLPVDRQPVEEQVVLACPTRPGRGPDAARLLARIRDLSPEVPTTVARTTLFANADADAVVWVVDVAGDPDEALDGLAASAVQSQVVRDLPQFVDVAHDITTRLGFRRLLAECTMRMLTDRGTMAPA